MLTRALVLWLLSEGPRHGYDIKRILGDASLGFWFALEDAAIYSCLRTLVKHGYARVAGTGREGKRPPKTTYAITREGREHLRDLLRRAWVELPSAAEPIHLALAAESELPAHEIADLRRERGRRLRARLSGLDDKAERAAPAREMATRLRALAEAELRWLRPRGAKRK